MRLKFALHLKKLGFYIIFFLVILSSCYQSNEKKSFAVEQTPNYVRPIPFMWIPKDKSIERILWFRFGKLPAITASKEDLLTNYIGSTHALSYVYSCAAFDSLLNLIQRQNPNIAGLRVYFGAHDQTYEPDGVPMNTNKIPDGQIVLIFAPTNASKTHDDLGKYYIFGSDGNPYPFTRNKGRDIKTVWLENYQSNEASSQEVLAVTLDQWADENKDLTTAQITDTKSILFCFTDFIDFIQTERHYQDSIIKAEASTQTIPAHTIDSIAMDFAAFPDTGIGPNHFIPSIVNSAFKNRLHVLFGFIRNGIPYYIDDSPDFYIRHSNAGQAPSYCKDLYRQDTKRWVLGGGGGDNGQLCPPYNCP